MDKVLAIPSDACFSTIHTPLSLTMVDGATHMIANVDNTAATKLQEKALGSDLTPGPAYLDPMTHEPNT